MIVRGVWPTAGARPFFANLKVMRAVLRCLEEATAPEGAVRAWVFLDDRFGFVVEGPEGLEARVAAARRRAEEGFRAENGQALWDPDGRCERLPDGTPDPAGPLARWPVEAGLADRPRDYPWCGGEWLIG